MCLNHNRKIVSHASVYQVYLINLVFALREFRWEKIVRERRIFSQKLWEILAIVF